LTKNTQAKKLLGQEILTSKSKYLILIFTLFSLFFRGKITKTIFYKKVSLTSKSGVLITLIIDVKTKRGDGRTRWKQVEK